jgi:hypothetical protein
MITDPTRLAEVRAAWQGFERLEGTIRTSIGAAVAQGGVSAVFAADAAYNLPFVHACAVLNDALVQLRDQREFTCGTINNERTTLGALVNAVTPARNPRLTWLDEALIKEIVDARNDIAHRGRILPRADCQRYNNHIRDQLTAWTIL